MDRKSILDKLIYEVIDKVSDHRGEDFIYDLTEDDQFDQKIWNDSLDRISFQMKVDEVFDIELDDDQYEDVETICHLIDLIEEQEKLKL